MRTQEHGCQFRFNRNDTIGTPDAEHDDVFLSDCFVDTGDLDVLRSCEELKRIVVGRTGAGKSALLRKLVETEEHVIRLKPSDLSLNYFANSEVLRFFAAAGTNLDPFYQLLWKHVIAVELIRQKYHITNETTQKTFLQGLQDYFKRNRAKEEAIAYLNKWGSNFWNETEFRVKEVLEKIEEELRASVGGSALGLKLEAGGAQRLTAEERQEVITRGARAVTQIQVSALSNVLTLLEEEVFTDRQEAYFVVIDDLDTGWVEDDLKYKLIRALIETVRAFKKVRQVKVVVALRLDLLQRVIAATRDSGFQSEKYESMYLTLRWTPAQLEDVVNRRLAHLVKQRYTSKPVSVCDLFPKKVQETVFMKFLCARTFLRPRDAILFVNECLKRAAERNTVTAQMVSDAEAAYSEKRKISLQEEWSSVFPYVDKYLEVLARRPNTFPVSELSRPVMEDWVGQSLLHDDDSVCDPVAIAARKCFLDGKGSLLDFVLVLLDALYTVGAIGIKPDSFSQVYWSYQSEHVPASGSIRPDTTIHIHPMFWRVLGVRPRGEVVAVPRQQTTNKSAVVPS